MAHRKLSLAGKYAVSLILVLMVFLPLLVTIISSLKIPGSLDAQSPLWISAKDMTLNNYLSVFKERYYQHHQDCCCQHFLQCAGGLHHRLLSGTL